jgi:hypothetical protein
MRLAGLVLREQLLGCRGSEEPLEEHVRPAAADTTFFVWGGRALIVADVATALVVRIPDRLAAGAM